MRPSWRDRGRSGLAATERQRAAPRAGLLASVATGRNVPALCLMYMPNSFAFYFCITWLPSYLKEKHGLESASLGIFAGLPLVLSVAADLLGGITTDKAVRRLSDRGWDEPASAWPRTSWPVRPCSLPSAPRMDGWPPPGWPSARPPACSCSEQPGAPARTSAAVHRSRQTATINTAGRDRQPGLSDPRDPAGRNGTAIGRGAFALLGALFLFGGCCWCLIHLRRKAFD